MPVAAPPPGFANNAKAPKTKQSATPAAPPGFATNAPPGFAAKAASPPAAKAAAAPAAPLLPPGMPAYSLDAPPTEPIVLTPIVSGGSKSSRSPRRRQPAAKAPRAAPPAAAPVAKPPARKRTFLGAPLWTVVAAALVAALMGIKKASRPGRRNAAALMKMSAAKRLDEVELDAAGAARIYRKVLKKHRRKLPGAAFSETVVEAAEYKLLDVLVRRDALDSPEAAGLIASAEARAAAASNPATAQRWTELASLAAARATDDDARWAGALDACAARRGCWRARVAAAGRAGAREVRGAAAEEDQIVASDGGWGSTAGVPRLCEVDVRSSLTAEAFRADYVDGGRPVVFPLAAGAADAWTRAALVDRLGDRVVPVETSPGALVRRRGGAREAPPGHETLADVVAAQPLAGGGYVFAADPFDGVDLAETSGAAAYFDDAARFSRDAEARRRSALFYLGGRGSETNAHEHANAYNALFFGAKLFALLPPLTGSFRRDGRGSALEHLAAARPEAVARLFPERPRANASAVDVAAGPRATPKLCVLRSGHALFIPTGWAHAIVNLADSVGVAVEVGDRPDLWSPGGPS